LKAQNRTPKTLNPKSKGSALSTLAITIVLLLGVVTAIAALRPGTPTLRGFFPESCFKGNPTFDLEVGGSNFVNGSVVQWNGVDLTTTFSSPTILHATVPSGDVANAGLFPITVKNPDNSVSNSLNFHVYNPVVPVIYSLTPYVRTRNTGPFQMTVDGQGFNATSVVQWNGTGIATQFNNTRQVVATVPNTDLQVLGAVNIKVVNPGIGGGTSNVVPFRVVRINVDNPISGFAFGIKDLTVTAGQTVVWTNNDFTGHTVTRDVGTVGPSSGTIAPNGTYSFHIDNTIPVGTDIYYHCSFHGTAGNGTTFGTGMVGVLRVR